MKRITLILINILMTTIAFSQGNVGIGTNTPNSSSKLDIQANDKGILIPRVALLRADSASPISMPETSLMIYNTDSVLVSGVDSMMSVYPGYYFWTGTQWNKIMDNISDGNSGSSVAESEYLYAIAGGEDFAPNTYLGNFSTTTAKGLSLTAGETITLKAGITYELEGVVAITFNATSSTVDYHWRDNNGNILGNVCQISSINQAVINSNMPIAKAIVTPTTDIDVGLYCSFEQTNTSFRSDFGYISVKAISNQVAIEPLLTSEYLHANSTRENLMANSYIGNFTVSNSSGLSLTGGELIDLKAGVTYELEASIALDFVAVASSAIDYVWRNTDGTTYGNKAIAISMNNDSDGTTQSIAKAIVTPTQDITVGIYCTFEGNNTATRTEFSYINVKAISGQLPVVVPSFGHEFVQSTDGVTTEISLTSTKTKIMSVVAPSNGIWNIYGELYIEYTAGSANWEIRKNGTSISNGGSDATYGDGYAASNDWRKIHINRKNVNLQSGDLIEVFVWEANSSTAFQGHLFKPFVNLEKIAGLLPVSTTTNTTNITDITSMGGSGYLDIGSTRIQWGIVSSVSSGVPANITLPMPYANTSYSFVATCQTNGSDFARTVSTRGKSTTNVSAESYNPSNHGGTTAGFNWITIGLKP